MKHYFEFLFGALGFGFTFVLQAFMALAILTSYSTEYFALAFASLVPMAVCMLISSAIGDSISRDFCDSLRK